MTVGIYLEKNQNRPFNHLCEHADLWFTQISRKEKKHRFRLFVNKVEEGDYESTSNSLIVTGLLVSLGKIYTPKSWDSFIMSQNGAIEKDDLSVNT